MRRRASRASAVKSCASWPKGVTHMSRVAKKPVALAKGVELNIQAESISAKGPKGTLSVAKPAGIEVKVEDGHAVFSTDNAERVPPAGPPRGIPATTVEGVSA